MKESNTKLAIAQDSLNELVYLLGDTKYCCIAQETADAVRDILDDLIVENRRLEQDAEFKPGLKFKINAE